MQASFNVVFKNNTNIPNPVELVPKLSASIIKSLAARPSKNNDVRGIRNQQYPLTILNATSTPPRLNPIIAGNEKDQYIT